MAEANKDSVIINRQRFIAHLAETETSLRSMARVSRFPKDMCQMFEDQADSLIDLINKTRERVGEIT